jgi:hypothetical protein
MALTTTAQYFDDAEATWRMDSDLGRKGMLPLELIEPVKHYFSLDAHLVWFTDTLTSRWFEHARWWFTACFLLAPFAAIWLALVLRRDPCGPEARLLALVVLGLFFSQFLLSPIIAFRYLHPFPSLMLVCAAVICARYFAGPGSHARAGHELTEMPQGPLEGSRAPA